MESGDSEFTKLSVPTLKAFLKFCSQSVSGKKQELVACAIGSKNAFFSIHHDQPEDDTQKNYFSIRHHLSLGILANATVLASVLLFNSRLSFHCYT